MDEILASDSPLTPRKGIRPCSPWCVSLVTLLLEWAWQVAAKEGGATGTTTVWPQVGPLADHLFLTWETKVEGNVEKNLMSL